MVKSVFIPYSVKMSAEGALLARATGEMDKYRADLSKATEAAHAELNALLEDGYTIMTSHMLDAASQIHLVVVLYKPDREIALQQQLMDSGLIDRDQDGRPS
ncbi:MAG: hypothetical protein BroJett033_8080 [Chloroflexota bacterium]|nr:MAG: hypothetical protein BroJett033_8080 [Chloroflexota bacterium]